MGVLRFHSRVESVEGNVVTLERALPFNVSTVWMPTVYNHFRGISEVGIQDLTVQMKWSRYPGHFLEPGYNGVEFSDASK